MIVRKFRVNKFFITLLISVAIALLVTEGSILVPQVAQASFLEEAWGQAGIVAYQAAAKTMRARNGEGQPLDNFQKRYLRRYFIDLIDRVAVIYNAQMMDRWVVSGMAIRVGTVESAAQTYCDRIYVRDPYKLEDTSQLIVLSHEMVHVRQCKRLGGHEQFGYNYFKEFKRAGQAYEKNKLEQEAYKFQAKFAKTL